jgi:outer membrane protein assembly factor BamB
MRRLAAAIGVACALIPVGTIRAQRPADWMTSANDAQRSSWVRMDAKISLESMREPGFQLVWKQRFDNQPRQLNTLMPPALLDFYISYRGFRSLAFFGGSADRVIAIDTELARLEWEKKYPTTAPSTSTSGCPGGMTTAVTRPTDTAYPPVPSRGGEGRGTPAKSGVGLPHEGAVILKTLAPPPPPPAAAAKPAAVPAFNPYAPRVQYALALTGDGKLHSLWVSNGHEAKPGVPFLPPDAHAQGLIAYDGTAYVATTGGCGSAGNGVWAINLGTNAVSHWKAGRDVAGTAGPAVGPDGKLYVAAGDELVALAPRSLETLAIYKAGGAEFSSTPVVFEFKDRNLIAVASNDGRLHLLDTATLNRTAPLDKTAPFSAPNYAAGNLASWQDPSGNRWILAPADGSIAASAGFRPTHGEIQHGAIVAWKLVDKDGVPSLEPGWISRDLMTPLPPIVVNGVVFALSSGEFRSPDPRMPAAERARRSTNAVLYALDAANGKELWNSGSTITSFVHSGGLAAGGSRVYVATYEGTQYAFGFPIEH